MKIAGFLIILNAVILTAWWGSAYPGHKGWAVVVCILALFAGIVVMLQDRAIEISLKGVGTIKAAAQQASVDAAAIATLKERVEAQSATVDLVAKSAGEARELVGDLAEKSRASDERLAQVDEATRQAEAALKDLERATEFATVLLAAQNDSWNAFEQLRKWADDKSFPLQQIAENAHVKIRVSYALPFAPGYLNIKWAPGVDPAKLTFRDFVRTYGALDPVVHTHLVNTVWDRSDISERDRMCFLILVLKTSNSLTAKSYAAKHFVKAAKDKELNWEPFHIAPLLRWWDENSDAFKPPSP